MGTTSGRDDEGYPAAPLPAHEREWRHPSEVGAELWHRTEPPLRIGRGLLAATAAGSVAIGATVGWAMWSTQHHRATAARAAIAIESTSAPTPHEPTPPTYRVDDGSVAEEPAIAVPLSSGHVVVTTTRAIAGADALALRDSAGRTHTARVVMIDEEAGLALLSTDPLGQAPPSSDPSFSDPAFSLASGLSAGDRLILDEDTVVLVREDGTVVREWFDVDRHEGSPVLNQRGELVGLCSRTGAGVRVVLLDDLDDLLAELAAGN